MTEQDQKQLGTILWGIADQLRGAMNADDFRDYMLSFLFLRYLSDNYELAVKKELGRDYPDNTDQPGTTQSSELKPKATTSAVFLSHVFMGLGSGFARFC